MIEEAAVIETPVVPSANDENDGSNGDFIMVSDENSINNSVLAPVTDAVIEGVTAVSEVVTAVAAVEVHSTNENITINILIEEEDEEVNEEDDENEDDSHEPHDEGENADEVEEDGENGTFNYSFADAVNLFAQVRSGLEKETLLWTTIIDALNAAIERREVQQQRQQYALQSFAADCMHKVVFLLTHVPNAHQLSEVETTLIKEALNLSAQMLAVFLPVQPELLFNIAVLVDMNAFFYQEYRYVQDVRVSGFPAARRSVAIRLAQFGGFVAVAAVLERADFNWPGGEVINHIMMTLTNEDLCKQLSDSCKARLIAAVMTRMAAVSASAFVEEHEQHLSKVLPILSKLHHMIPISSIVAVKAEATAVEFYEQQEQQQKSEDICRCIDKYLQQRLLYVHKMLQCRTMNSDGNDNRPSVCITSNGSSSGSNTDADKSERHSKIAYSAWPLLDDLIVEAGITVPFAQSYVVSGAGSNIANGVYHAVPRQGDVSGVPTQFVKERSNPHEPKMSLMLCTLKSKARWWFIGAPDAEKPGTDKDMDYYLVVTSTRKEYAPPALGWRFIKSGTKLHGAAPQPIIRPFEHETVVDKAATGTTKGDIAVTTDRDKEETISDRLMRWAVENKMVEYISKYRSVEGLKVSEELLKFLAVNGALTSADAKVLFDLVATSEADVSKAAIEVVVKAASVMDSDVFGYLIQSMIDTMTPSALAAKAGRGITTPSVDEDADEVKWQAAFDRIAQFVTFFSAKLDVGSAVIVELSNDSIRHLAQLLWQLSRVPATLWRKNHNDAAMLQQLLNFCFYHKGCGDFASSCIQNCADAIRIISEGASSSSSSSVDDDSIAQHRKDAEIESNLDALESLLYENCTPYILDKLSTSSVPQILFDEVKRYVEDQRASAVATPTSTTDTATASVFGKQLRKRLQLLKRFYTIDETISTPLALIERLSKLLNNSAVEIEEFYFFLQSPGVRSSTTELAAMRARGMQQSLFTAAAPATSTATTSNTQSSSSSSSSASSSSTPAVVPAPTASYTMPYLMMPPNHSVDLTSKYHALRFQQLEVGMNSSLSQGYSQQAALQQCNDQLSGNSRIVESLSGQVESLTAKVDQLTSQLSSLTVALERICGHPSSQKKA